jgi:Family of unknown function (DUF5670)
VTRSFGRLSAHRLFIFPSEPWANPAAGLSAPTFRADADAVFEKRACDARARTDSAGRLAATTLAGQLHGRLLERSAASGGEMLFKIAFVLLVAWLLGILGAYPAGDLVHVLLLVGFMLLLLAFLRGHDAAVPCAVGGDPDKP